MKVAGFERPEVLVLGVLSALFGIGVSYWLLPGDWSLGLRVVIGALLGATAVLSVFANRMIGGTDFE